MDHINNLFLESNRVARSKILQDAPAILLVNNDTVTLYKNGKMVQEKKLDLENYHTIKNVVHFITGKIVGHICDGDHEIQDDCVKHAIVENKEVFIFEAVKYWCLLLDLINQSGTDKLDESCIRLAMKHASHLYLSELHGQVQEMRRLVDGKDWDQLVVVVTGPPSPRQGHTAMQYFSRLTGKEDQFAFVPTNDEAAAKSERKLFYVENVYNPQQALDIVAQLILERKVFDRVVDMKTDILAYDSKEYLKRVCGK